MLAAGFAGGSAGLGTPLRNHYDDRCYIPGEARRRGMAFAGGTCDSIGACGPDTADIQGRIQQTRTQIQDTTPDCDREKLEERLAKLAAEGPETWLGRLTRSKQALR